MSISATEVLVKSGSVCSLGISNRAGKAPMETGKGSSSAGKSDQQRLTILIVDDDPLMLESLRQVFEDEYEVELARNGSEAVETVERGEHSFACIIMDIRMPRMDGVEAAIRIRGINPNQEIVMNTGYADEYKESDLQKLIGPSGFVAKGGAYEHLYNSVTRAIDHYLLHRNSHLLADEFARDHQIVGHSKAMRDLYIRAKKLAPGTQPVLISGASGSGKELFARAIHELSGRTKDRFECYNCSQFSGEQFVVESMGVSPGVYTNVHKEYLGMFERADSGTLFLDEIADLPPDAQAKLLRVLNDGKLHRITDPNEIEVDVRTICASNRPLDVLVERGEFREDLFHRLNGSQIEIPPLNQRKEDIPALVEYFASLYAEKAKLLPVQFHNKALSALVQADWSENNVRQLRNCVESIIIESGSNFIMVDDVEPYLVKAAGKGIGSSASSSLKDQVGLAERDIIIAALIRTNGVAKDAAAELDIDPSVLTRKMIKYEIDLKGLKGSLRSD